MNLWFENKTICITYANNTKSESRCPNQKEQFKPIKDGDMISCQSTEVSRIIWGVELYQFL